MITKPTVFILGAGASMPYGFPSGRELVEHICAALLDNKTWRNEESNPLISRKEIRKVLIEEFGENETNEFGNALFLSNQFSIDAFLEHRPEFMQIGKLAISLFILRMEKEDNLFSVYNRDKGCYQYLFSKLNARWDDFKENKIGFVSFNYDRSLEHFLFNALQNTYNKSEEECSEQINTIPLIHVHGYLGTLRWQELSGIPYGTLEKGKSLDRFIFNPEKAKLAANQINIITEDQILPERLQSTFKLLGNAEHIYFLGFGYHPTNMERLNLLNLPKIKQLQKTYQDQSLHVKHSHISGTALGMEDAEIHNIQNTWDVRLPDNSSDSLLFLRKYAIFN